MFVLIFMAIQRLQTMRRMRLLLIALGVMFSCTSFGAANSGVTYQGRILKPDGTPLNGATVQFKMQIRTPDSSNCLMYEELQTLDMRNSSGIFSLTINDGSGARMDTSGFTLDRIFGNRGSFTFDPSTCSGGSTYAPNAGDGRILAVLFKDETMSSWEPIPPQRINFVPFAFEAKQIAGFSADSLLRVVNGSGDPLTGVSPLSNAQYTELLALLNGTSSKFSQLGGVALPTMTSGEVLGWNGTAWVSQPAVAGANSVTTTMIQAAAVDSTKIANGAVGTNQVAGDVSINTSGTLGAAVTTTRDFKIYAASPSTEYVEMKAPALGTGASYTLTWPLDDGAAGQVLTTDGSGVLSWAAAGTSSQWTTHGSNISYDGGGNVGIGTTAPGSALDIKVPIVDPAADVYGFRSYLNTTNTADGTQDIIGASLIAASSGTTHANGSLTGSLSQGFNSSGSGTTTDVIGAQNTAVHAFMGTTTNLVGTKSYARNASIGTATTVTGVEAHAEFMQGTTTTLYGGSFLAENQSNTTTVPTAYGVKAETKAGAGGTITNGYGLYAAVTPNGGTITNRYGVYVSDVGSGAKFYNVYSNGSGKNYFGGNVGIGTTAPSAKLTLAAGTASAGTAPLKFAQGTLLTTPEDGAMEYDSSGLWFTVGSTRYVIPINTAAGNYSNVSTIGNTSGSITMTPLSGNSVVVNSTTVSTSPTTGALVVSGGAGIDGAVNVSGNMTSGGSITASGSITAAVSGIIPQLYGSTSAGGDIRIDGTSNAAAGDVLLATASPLGNVGIGTTAPSYKLDVTGSLRATSSVTSDHEIYAGTSVLIKNTSVLASGVSGDAFDIAAKPWNFVSAPSSAYLTRIASPTLTGLVSPGTITNAYTAYIEGAPKKGTNATLTNTIALGIGSQNVVGAANAYGLYANAPAGATNNYAAVFMGGNVGIGTTEPVQALEVNGGLKIGTTSVTGAGSLRWNGTNFQGYNGSAWQNLIVDLPASGSCDTSQVFNTPGTYAYTVPASFGTITIKVWGGGGPGGYYFGLGGTSGGSSTITSLGLAAGGGGPGTNSGGGGIYYGSGGAASGGSINVAGANGSNGTLGSISGNGGSAPSGGGGGNGVSAGPGTDGAVPGGGGGGGALGSGYTNGGGGSGGYTEKTFTTATLPPGTTINDIIVGAGGVYGGPVGHPQRGGAGGNGQVTITCSSTGAPPVNNRSVLFLDSGSYSSDVNFVYDSSGHVGIGTTSPQATLDVNGLIRLKTNSSEPVACSAANEGTLALTSHGTMCDCHSGAWVSTTDGATACSW